MEFHRFWEWVGRQRNGGRGMIFDRRSKIMIMKYVPGVNWIQRSPRGLWHTSPGQRLGNRVERTWQAKGLRHRNDPFCQVYTPDFQPANCVDMNTQGGALG